MWKTLGQRWSSPALHTRRLFLPLLLPACGQGPSLGKRLAPGLLILPGHPEPMLAEGREQPLAVPMSDAAWTAFWAQGMLARGRREGRREGGREGRQYARGVVGGRRRRLGFHTYFTCKANCFTLLCLRFHSWKVHLIILFASLGYSRDEMSSHL